MKKRQRIDISGSTPSIVNNPFGVLDPGTFHHGPGSAGEPAAKTDGTRGVPKKSGKRGRIDVIRQKAGRGGKTVTLLVGFKGVATAELEVLARELRKACGVGGTVKGTTIEIQGDQTVRAMEHLISEGFKPVRAGG